jgi:hypothetical protein
MEKALDSILNDEKEDRLVPSGLELNEFWAGLSGGDRVALLALGSVRGAGQSEFSGGDDIVAEFAEETGGQRVNVLVEQEPHEAAPTWMSSV